jgi:hypothetical protein
LKRRREREIVFLRGCSMCLVVTHYHLSQRVITGDIATHGKLQEGNRRKTEERKGRRERKKIQTSFCEEEIDWFTNGI